MIISPEETAARLEKAEAELLRLRKEVSLLRREREKAIGDSAARIEELVSSEVGRLRRFVKESLREISEETASDIYRLQDEARRLRGRLEAEAEKKARKAVRKIETRAERRIADGVMKRIDRRTGNMRRELREAERKAITDELTGIFNRRYFENRLRMEYSMARRLKVKLSLLIIDIDGFKSVNDTLGHPAGDRVLETVAGVLQKGMRLEDLTSRYGGDEFTVILPGMGAGEAFSAAERLRKEIEKKTVKINGKSIRVTVSAGVACYPDDASSCSELFEVTDRRLLEAKKSGKNRVCGP